MLTGDTGGKQESRANFVSFGGRGLERAGYLAKMKMDLLVIRWCYRSYILVKRCYLSYHV